MSAYLICLVDVQDPETYSRYTALSPAIVAQHGGRFVVRTPAATTLEGNDPAERVVIVEFPDEAAAHAFYNSPEYQAAKLIREPAANARFIVARGVG